MKKLTKKFIFVFLIVLFFRIAFPLFAEDQNNTDEQAQDLKNKIEEYQQKIEKLQGEQQTLSSTIEYFNNKINLTSTQISQTENEIHGLEKDIDTLNAKIGILDKSLTEVSQILNSRVSETYKINFVNPFYFFVSSSQLSDAISRLKYLRTIQMNDREILFRMQKSKMSFDQQKQLKEQKQKEKEALQAQLREQQNSLAEQKQEKAYLLEKTKNDEAEYQRLLSVAKSEFEAIQAIVAGHGDEDEVGEVSKGEQIASIISGQSCNSSGSHLHFMVVENGENKNPFNYLKSIEHNNCSGCDYQNGQCLCKASDPFNPSGSWDWPIDGPVEFNQGYGNSWSVNNIPWLRNIYTFHNGIDIYNPSDRVKAVADGSLYRGSYNVGCQLRYVRLEHKDSDLETYYLHVNYF